MEIAPRRLDGSRKQANKRKAGGGGRGVLGAGGGACCLGDAVRCRQGAWRVWRFVAAVLLACFDLISRTCFPFFIFTQEAGIGGFISLMPNLAFTNRAWPRRSLPSSL
jgi:hypothetical protein